MKKYFTIISLLALTILLTGCVEKVEQRTIECTEGSEVVFQFVYQEDRIMIYNYNDDLIERSEVLEDVLFIEEMIFEEFGGDTFFEIEDDMLEDIEFNLGVQCEITTENVEFIEDQETDGVSEILENTQKDSVMADALAIENASKLYCSQTECSDTQELTWDDLNEYVMGINEDDYDFTNNNGVISTRVNNEWTIDMERTGTGEWEFTQDLTPSECDRSCVIEDID